MSDMGDDYDPAQRKAINDETIIPVVTIPTETAAETVDGDDLTFVGTHPVPKSMAVLHGYCFPKGQLGAKGQDKMKKCGDCSRQEATEALYQELMQANDGHEVLAKQQYTSRDVCELYTNGGGIVRVLGRRNSWRSFMSSMFLGVLSSVRSPDYRLRDLTFLSAVYEWEISSRTALEQSVNQAPMA